jgi:hypothetical protein
VTWPTIAEVASVRPGGHIAAGADWSLSLLAWIHSLPARTFLPGALLKGLEPGDDPPRPGFMTLITRADCPG